MGRRNQTKYDYSLREHAAVLGALRDACRRFTIDTDRVFLSGHSMGGDAAWDIGLAHPDLWAGVIPVVATADKYVSRYWKNAKGLPMYFVAGQLDGNKIAANARDLDRYMKYAGFDAMYVEYEGRGHEHFHDEIQRMFEWMALYRRDFARKEFDGRVHAALGSVLLVGRTGRHPRAVRRAAGQLAAAQGQGCGDGGADYAGQHDSRQDAVARTSPCGCPPTLVDFAKKITFGRDRVDIVPTIEVMLEDVRTRGDRQHPFWAKYSPPTGKRSVACLTSARDARPSRHVLRGDYGTSLLSRQPATNQPSSSLRTYTPAGPR